MTDGNNRVTLALVAADVQEMKPMVQANHDFRIKAETALAMIKWLVGLTLGNGILVTILLFN